MTEPSPIERRLQYGIQSSNFVDAGCSFLLTFASFRFQIVSYRYKYDAVPITEREGYKRGIAVNSAAVRRRLANRSLRLELLENRLQPGSILPVFGSGILDPVLGDWSGGFADSRESLFHGVSQTIVRRDMPEYSVPLSANLSRSERATEISAIVIESIDARIADHECSGQPIPTNRGGQPSAGLTADCSKLTAHGMCLLR